MISSKNGQSMPINVIIIVVLGLLVLIVLGWIFSGQANRFAGAASCSGQSGVYMQSKEGSQCASNETIIMTSDCKNTVDDSKKDGQCCIPVFR